MIDFRIVLDLQENCENPIEFPYVPNPASPIVNIWH